MALVDLPFRAGFFTEDTERDVGKGRYWQDGNMVRFRLGLPETIGGWVKDSSAAISGVPRAATDWATLAGRRTIAVGSNSKLYVWQSNIFYDITPAGFVAGAVDYQGLSGSYGSGAYGSGSYGGASSGTIVSALHWSLDNWGEDLIACASGGNVYLWDASVGTGTAAAVISAAPTNNKFAFVSTEDRHLIVGGAGGDPMLVQWCAQEDYTSWTPTAANTAGDKRLDQGNILLTVVKLKAEHLLYTDAALYSMTFIGPPDTFGFRPLGANYGLVGPRAAIEAAGKAYWMGNRGFYTYDGTVRPLVCPVLNHILDNINTAQIGKTHCAHNIRFNEVWWFYPSSTSSECDRYVLYNTEEQTWAFGVLARNVFIGNSDVIEFPYAISTSGDLYYHELGTSNNGAARSIFLESGAFELTIPEAGNKMLHISKVIPDFVYLFGAIDFTIELRHYPQEQNYTISGPYTITSSIRFINPRVRGRQASMLFASNSDIARWRLGIPRVDMKPHGGR